MQRAKTLTKTAKPNSVTTSHQKVTETERWADTARTMPSMISLVIQRSRTGNSDASRRETRPNTTTAGPESHTVFRTGGTLLHPPPTSPPPFAESPPSSPYTQHRATLHTP